MNDMNTEKVKNVRSGFALPGMVMNITLSGVLLLGAGSLGLSNARKVAAMASYPSLNRQDQKATDLIAQDIRGASSVESASDTQIVLKGVVTGGASTVAYTFNPAARTLTRTEGSSMRTLLTDVDSFAFSLFQRPAAGAPYGTFAPATARTAKMVGCRWSCSRKVAGAKVDSESIQIAPVILRSHS
jgi:hypothetical protein